MSRHDPVTQRVFPIIEPVCESAGFELVDLRFTNEQGGWILRVYIDRKPGPPAEVVHIDGEDQAVSDAPDDDGADDGADDGDGNVYDEGLVDLDDCERMSRELSAVLDVADPIAQAYSLEVSSPGVDRPLRTPAHFRRHLGDDVKIAMAVPVAIPSGERRNFKGPVVEVEGEGDDAIVVVEIDGKDRFRLRLGDIDQARLVPDWDKVMHKHEKPSKPGAAGKHPGRPGHAKKAKN